MKKANNIFLIGFMGCGKSSVAKKLQEMHQMKVVEMDEEIELQEGRSISDIFCQSGETYFRDAESTLLKSLQDVQGRVISCGGGVVLREENIRIMKSCGSVVWLTASAKTILERVHSDESRPILQGRKTIADIQTLMEERYPYYEAAADLSVSTEHKTVAQIAEEIFQQLEKVGN